MKVDEYPNLLIVTKLVESIGISMNKIREIRKLLHPDTEEVFIQGGFVLSVASMEIMMSDILRYYLICFPQKLSTDFKFEKAVFFKKHFNLLEETIEKHLYGLFYKSFEDYFNNFLNYLSIEWEGFWESLGKYLQEIKCTRNSLLHNNLVNYDRYLECAGIAARSFGRLKIDYSYATNSLEKIIEFEECLEKLIFEKYQEYTKINANKRLWQFMFETPIMPYDDYWRYDKSKDHIFAMRRGRYEDDISSSEKMLLELWRSHFNRTGIENFNMKHLVGAAREKAMFFISIAGEFLFE